MFAIESVLKYTMIIFKWKVELQLLFVSFYEGHIVVAFLLLVVVVVVVLLLLLLDTVKFYL